ncbi:hypothetical protein KGO95_04020 [Patescibacteria group bacterium]|nr:hypothetical protein [Patescibacteria group bacterium]
MDKNKKKVGEKVSVLLGLTACALVAFSFGFSSGKKHEASQGLTVNGKAYAELSSFQKGVSCQIRTQLDNGDWINVPIQSEKSCYNLQQRYSHYICTGNTCIMGRVRVHMFFQEGHLRMKLSLLHSLTAQH